MKYSKTFERDYSWFLSVMDFFGFDGRSDYINKHGKEIVVSDTNGVSAKEAFYLFDSQGIIKPTKEPNELRWLLKVKGSINLHIEMYANDLDRGYLLMEDFKSIAAEIKAPQWFLDAVFNQMKRNNEKRKKEKLK